MSKKKREYFGSIYLKKLYPKGFEGKSIDFVIDPKDAPELTKIIMQAILEGTGDELFFTAFPQKKRVQMTVTRR